MAEETDGSDWLAPAPPLELGDGLTPTAAHGLRVGEGWFPEKTGVVTKRKRDGFSIGQLFANLLSATTKTQPPCWGVRVFSGGDSLAQS